MTLVHDFRVGFDVFASRFAEPVRPRLLRPTNTARLPNTAPPFCPPPNPARHKNIETRIRAPTTSATCQHAGPRASAARVPQVPRDPRRVCRDRAALQRGGVDWEGVSGAVRGAEQGVDRAGAPVPRTRTAGPAQFKPKSNIRRLENALTLVHDLQRLSRPLRRVRLLVRRYRTSSPPSPHQHSPPSPNTAPSILSDPEPSPP
ncbi:hypothetical protein BJ912DRAFT_980932 [Pholiota molesta]|nr:hypothetical protein BJ912DRAFT_980932 [Pholiota molesta]